MNHLPLAKKPWVRTLARDGLVVCVVVMALAFIGSKARTGPSRYKHDAIHVAAHLHAALARHDLFGRCTQDVPLSNVCASVREEVASDILSVFPTEAYATHECVRIHTEPSGNLVVTFEGNWWMDRPQVSVECSGSGVVSYHETP